MTIQEKQEQEKIAQKAKRELYNALVRGVKSNCRTDRAGLLAVKYQLELIERGGQKLPDGLDQASTVAAYKEGIEKYTKKRQDELEK